MAEPRVSSFLTLRAAPWTAAARRRFAIWQVGITLGGREGRALHLVVISNQKEEESGVEPPQSKALRAPGRFPHLPPTTYHLRGQDTGRQIAD